MISFDEEKALPTEGTMARTVLDYFYEVGAVDTESVRKDLSDEFTRDQVTSTISRLLTDKFITRCEAGLRVSVPIAKRLKIAKLALNPANITPPPDRNVFGPELKPSNYMRTTGTREGSNEHLTWSSKHV